MTTETKNIISQIRNAKNREFCITEDFEDRTFLDAFIDVTTPPEDLPPRQTDHGFLARIRDGHQIREYFRKAVNKEKQRQAGHTPSE